MKSLNMYLGSVIDNDGLHFESLLDDDDIFLDSGNEKKLVKEWINDNYKIDGNLTISDDLIVDCSGSVYIRNKSITSLTNGLFRWDKVDRNFDCSYCSNIKSLEGAPEWVGGRFCCNDCDNLTSLEGAPKGVIGMFSCSQCNNLKTLKGAPKKVVGGFYCGACMNLTSLEGAPKEVGRDFNCGDCEKLTSLEGAPEKVGGGFACRGCKKLKITRSDHKKYKIME